MRPALLLPAVMLLAGCASAARGNAAVEHARVALLGDGSLGETRASFLEASTVGRARPITDPSASRAVRLPSVIDPIAPSPGATTRPAGLLSGSDARCPAEMALVDGKVCVDRWEATLVVLDHGTLRPLSPYELVDHLTGYRAVSRPGVIPQGYISGVEGERACLASGKRLCTISEWERGCRGPEQLHYPYGDTRKDGVCNDTPRARHPVVEAAAQMHIPSDQMWTAAMNLPIINQLPDSLLPTGEKSECVSADGLYDMVGNLHEWVADADGTFRGGYYMDTSKNGEGCSYRTSAHDFDYHDYSTGFRCCADPDPIE
ncbi:MAG: SUMF1/EgtB/PvdO family nonheme iron enzyme [Polyangiaceae bacterium]